MASNTEVKSICENTIHIFKSHSMHRSACKVMLHRSNDILSKKMADLLKQAHKYKLQLRMRIKNPLHNLNIVMIASYLTKGYILSPINAIFVSGEYKGPKELGRAKRM